MVECPFFSTDNKKLECFSECVLFKYEGNEGVCPFNTANFSSNHHFSEFELDDFEKEDLEEELEEDKLVLVENMYSERY